MFKISKNLSVSITIVICIICLIAVAGLAVALPFITNDFLRTEYPQIVEEHYVSILVTLYVALIPATAALISLLRLLSLVRRESVFTSEAVALLRMISWCCFAEIPVFAVCTVFFLFFAVSLALAFAALFMGLILRVVKNVIEEAVALKNENDFTV